LFYKQTTRGGQPAHPPRGKHQPCERTIDRGDLSVEEVDAAHRPQHLPLVAWQDPLG
jgi:hypothetical protein